LLLVAVMALVVGGAVVHVRLRLARLVGLLRPELLLSLTADGAALMDEDVNATTATVLGVVGSVVIILRFGILGDDVPSVE